VARFAEQVGCPLGQVGHCRCRCRCRLTPPPSPPLSLHKLPFAQVYQQLHEREESLSAELGLAQAQLFPLRKDNARLVRSVNELHRDAIASAEANEAELRGLRLERSRLATLAEEAAFLRAQGDAQLGARQAEVEQLQAKLQAFSDAFDGIDSDMVRAVSILHF